MRWWLMGPNLRLSRAYIRLSSFFKTNKKNCCSRELQSLVLRFCRKIFARTHGLPAKDPFIGNKYISCAIGKETNEYVKESRQYLGAAWPRWLPVGYWPRLRRLPLEQWPDGVSWRSRGVHHWPRSQKSRCVRFDREQGWSIPLATGREKGWLTCSVPRERKEGYLADPASSHMLV